MGEIPELNEENLLNEGMELENPEKYVAALKPFGEAIDQNPEIALSEEHVSRYVGENLSLELRMLTEWDYLTEIGAEELNINRTDSSFYRLNTEDREVQADAVFSSMHINDYYGGSVEKFLNQHSDEDRDRLRKQGVNFYKTVG